MNHLRLIVNGQPLDLPADLRLRMEQINPIFEREIQDGSHSFSFLLPLTPTNQVALGFSESPIVYQSTVSLNVIIEAYGLPWLEGVMQILSAGPTGYSARIEADISPLATKLKTTRLKDLDLGGVRNIANGPSLSQQLSITNSTPNGDAGIGVNGINYYVTWTISQTEFTVLDTLVDAINNDTATHHVIASTQLINSVYILILTLQPGFSSLAIDIFIPGNQQTWTYQNELGQAQQTHDLIRDHMRTVSLAGPGAYDYCFAPIHAPDWYDAQNQYWQNYVNYWDWDAQAYLRNEPTTSFEWRNSAVPFPRVGYVFEQLLAHIGYTDASAFTQTSDWTALYLWNNLSLDYERQVNATPFNGWRSTINLQDHVPADWTLATFLIWLRDKFNLAIIPDLAAKTIRLEMITTIPGKVPKDFSGLSLQGIVVNRKAEEDRGYELAHEVDDSDRYGEEGILETAYPNYVFDAGATLIESPAGPLYEKTQTHPLGGEWRTPSVRQLARSVWTGLEYSEGAARVIFFRGMVAGATGKLYPLATSGNLDYLGNVIGEWGLAWTATGSPSTSVGLYDYFWKNWLEGRAEEAEINMGLLGNVIQMNDLRYDTPHTFVGEQGSFNAVIKRVSTDLSPLGPETTVQLHRL